MSSLIQAQVASGKESLDSTRGDDRAKGDFSYWTDKTYGKRWL